jgi:hypothetical protein
MILGADTSAIRTSEPPIVSDNRPGLVEFHHVYKSERNEGFSETTYRWKYRATTDTVSPETRAAGKHTSKVTLSCRVCGSKIPAIAYQDTVLLLPRAELSKKEGPYKSRQLALNFVLRTLSSSLLPLYFVPSLFVGFILYLSFFSNPIETSKAVKVCFVLAGAVLVFGAEWAYIFLRLQFPDEVVLFVRPGFIFGCRSAHALGVYDPRCFNIVTKIHLELDHVHFLGLAPHATFPRTGSPRYQLLNEAWRVSGFFSLIDKPIDH